jgi:putative pyruvate formate lyase activating enzyme
MICAPSGSGTIFFSGCSLRCLACQNHSVSQGAAGEELSPAALCDLFLRLQEMGACNINLVTPTHQTYWILNALKLSRDKLHIPIIWNTSGYEHADTIRALRGYVDIYLTDIKFFSPALSFLYASASDYFEKASKALEIMVSQCPVVWGDNGLIKTGVIVRHLMLPGQNEDTLQILTHLESHFSPGDFYISLMRQYTPCHKALSHPPFHRSLTELEYKKAVKWLENSSFNGYVQEKNAVGMEYVPAFTSSENGSILPQVLDR